MAVSLVNPKLSLSDSQRALLEKARSQYGFHVYYEGDGESTTNTYSFPMASDASEGSPSVVLAVNIASGFKTFDWRLYSSTSDRYVQYTYPNPDKKDSREPVVWRKYNDQDVPLEAACTKVRIRPGMRIIRFTMNEELLIKFDVDSELLFGELTYITELNRVSVKTDNGCVLEGHCTGRDAHAAFDSPTLEMPTTPKLAPGAYIEITGNVEAGFEPKFLLSQKGWPDHKPQLVCAVKLPDGQADRVIWVVRFYAKKLTIDTGEKIYVHDHNFVAPARFGVREFTLHNVLLVRIYDPSAT